MRNSPSQTSLDEFQNEKNNGVSHNSNHVHYVPPVAGEQTHGSAWPGRLDLPGDKEKNDTTVHVLPTDIHAPLGRRRSSVGVRMTPQTSRDTRRMSMTRRFSVGGTELTEEEHQMALKGTIEHGEHKYKRLGWLQLVVVLIVEAIALGSLSLPK